MLGILNLMNFKHSAMSIANTDTMVFELLSNLVYTHGLRRKTFSSVPRFQVKCKSFHSSQSDSELNTYKLTKFVI